MILKEEQKELLRQMIEDDERSGLYTTPPPKVYLVQSRYGTIYACFDTKDKADNYTEYRDDFLKIIELEVK